MVIYFSKRRIILTILCVAFAYSFLNFPKLNWSVYVLSKAFCAGVLILYIVANMGIIFHRKYQKINCLILTYSVLTVVSLCLNSVFSYYAFVILLLRVTMPLFVEIQREKGHIKFLYKVMFAVFSAGIAANDILMIMNPARFYGDGIGRTFLLGNKFDVGYDHLITLILAGILFGHRKRWKKWYVLAALITVVICRFIDCNTAVLGAGIILMITFMSGNTVRYLERKISVLTATVLAATFVFFTNLVQLPVLRYFVTGVLGRDITLTGRMQIYRILPKVIRARIWTGYGTSNAIIEKYTNAFDAQNGFFDLVVSYGFPAAILFIIMLIFMIKETESWEGKCLTAGIYAYIIMSMAEITYGITLLFFAISLYSIGASIREYPIVILEVKNDKNTTLCE